MSTFVATLFLLCAYTIDTQIMVVRMHQKNNSILAMWLHGVYDGKSVSLHEVTIGCCVERYAVATHGFSLAIVHAL